MITKQKTTMRILVFVAALGVCSVLFSLTQQNYVAFAQSSCEDQIGGCPTEANPPADTAEGGTLDCGGVKTSIIGGDVCGDGTNEKVIFNILSWVLKIMTAGVGVAAVGGIGYGALLYTTAEGKPDQTKKAIGIITNVVIGIAAYALMAVLLNFLIPGGIIN